MQRWFTINYHSRALEKNLFVDDRKNGGLYYPKHIPKNVTGMIIIHELRIPIFTNQYNVMINHP